jgi:aminoglycoside phosphotransferase (APT) family kinase protein
MATTPPAEVDISPGLVRRLLEEQHPDLAGESLSLVAAGWDNSIYRLGADLLVRLPRRVQSSQLVLNEQRWLPDIAARVAVQVPVPVRAGVPSDFYPWPWSITPWFTGDVAAHLPRAERGGLAEPLAKFLLALADAAPDDAPSNPFRAVPLARRDADMRARFRSDLVPHAVHDVWDRSLAQPEWDGGRLWVHGDLHPANLVTENGMLRAVIDFGDLSAGDPATDLAAAWLVFDASGRERFRTAIARRGDFDAATWRRAEGWALCMATAVLVSSDDSPLHRRIGTETIAEILSGR